nr:hypothetical protein GCM10017745_10160 [Saccharothrix mutabilis subsp. capreolus]
MRITRKIAGLTTMVATVLGLGLAGAGSAVADAGVWRAYGNTNPITSSTSTWRCSSSTTIAASVSAQVCAVRSHSGASVQTAVIVRNNGSGLYVTEATASMYTLYNGSYALLGTWSCPPSGVAANSWSVCFGSTFTYTGSVTAQGQTSTADLGWSPFA